MQGVSVAPQADIVAAYDFVRGHYTTSERVVPCFRNSQSNLSQASLNRDMLRMLELEPGMTIADLGSGCGITANSFAVFGASKVVGYEFHALSCDVARDMALKIRASAAAKGFGDVAMPSFVSGAVNDHLSAAHGLTFDRLHGGYMMSQANATKYVRENLSANGVAVLNVGRRNDGEIIIYRKDAAGNVQSRNSGISVIFQEDHKP